MTSSPPAGRRKQGTHRRDIEGLRAVAVVSVVAYHAHLGLFSGGYVGVDVFFVISGYLITDLLWRELQSTGRIDFMAFYARRIRRLLPAAMTVLILTLLVAALWVPPLEMRSIWKDGLSSALYVGNYRFALIRSDYLNASVPPSPLQHYWSLGVEEQFYLVWPILLLVVARFGWRGAQVRTLPAAGTGQRAPRDGVRAATGDAPPPPAAAALTGLAVVAALSLGLSLWLTSANQPWAFFSLPTRAWELAAGGLVALAAPRLKRLPPTAATVGAWVGLGLIVWSVVAFTPTTAFPGTAALAPVLATAAVIAFGATASKWGPVVGLGRLGPRTVGKISYSWYLLHWPVLILAADIAGRTLSEWQDVLLAVGSGLLALVSYRLVELPARHSTWLVAPVNRSLGFGATLTVCGVAACAVAATNIPSVVGHGQAPVARISAPALGTGGTVAPTTPVKVNPATSSVSPTAAPVGKDASHAKSARSSARPGTPPANLLEGRLHDELGQVNTAVTRSAAATEVPANLVPGLDQASANEAEPFVDGCLLGFDQAAVPTCLFGDSSSSNSVVLFGDSHATMWFPAVDSYATTHQLALRVFTKATCPPVGLTIFSPDLGRTYSECDQWKASVLSDIAALRPSLVVLGIAPNYDSAYHIVQNGRVWLDGLQAMIASLRRLGARVVVMGPVPSPPDLVADCLSAHLDSTPSCSVAPGEARDGIGLVGFDTAGDTAEQRAVQQAGGWWVNVQPWFCTATACPGIVDNLLVYRDNSHITAVYGSYLAPLVSDELDLATSRYSLVNNR